MTVHHFLDESDWDEVRSISNSDKLQSLVSFSCQLRGHNEKEAVTSKKCRKKTSKLWCSCRDEIGKDQIQLNIRKCSKSGEEDCGEEYDYSNYSCASTGGSINALTGPTLSLSAVASCSHSSIAQREGEESANKCWRRTRHHHPSNGADDNVDVDNKESHTCCVSDKSLICTSGQCNTSAHNNHHSVIDPQLESGFSPLLLSSLSPSRNCISAPNGANGERVETLSLARFLRNRNKVEKDDKCQHTVKGKSSSTSRRRRKIVISSSDAASRSSSSATTVILFNFILFATFLLNSLNYCHLVRGDEGVLSNTNLTSNKSKIHKYYQVGNRSTGLEEQPKAPYISSVEEEKHHESIVDSDAKGKQRTATVEIADDENGLWEMLSKPLESVDKGVLQKAIWQAMTADEIHRIFGHQQPSLSSSSYLKSVPNFEITKPKITPLSSGNSEGKRRRRRSSTPYVDNESEAEKLIHLDGFGRQFTLNMHPNRRLLDPYFVQLHRHENRSEILSSELVEKELGCFYHGRASHRGEGNDVESGAVAMSLCGGMKGFILPTASSTSSTRDDDVGHPFYYVIHPLPDRLLKRVAAKSSPDHDANMSFSSNNEGQEDRHHIMFRRPGTIFPNLAPSSLLKSKNKAKFLARQKMQQNDRDILDDKGPTVNDEFATTTCMHHDTNNNDKLTATDYNEDSGVARNNNELDTILSQRYRTRPIITSADLHEPTPDLGSINDLESLSQARKIDSRGRNFRRRQKRSTSITNFDTETIDPFTYKPINNVPPDSYWIQFRDRGGGGLRTSSSTITSPVNFNNRRISSQFSYDGGSSGGISGPSRFISSSGGASPPFQPSYWHQQNHQRSVAHAQPPPHHNLPSRPSRGSRYDEIPSAPEYEDTGVAGSDTTWSKGILVFESSGSDEDRHYPGKDVPFYTKSAAAGKRKTKGISTTSSVVASTSSTSSSSSNTRSFDWFGGGVSPASSKPWNSPDKNRTSKSYSVSSDPATTRKGRRDDGVFGDKWKTSLDSEIIWADRSNEINKQSRFDDLSNVKDRPPSHLTIETAVFVDKDLYKHMQQNFPEDTQGEVTRIVLAMINAVQLLYQDPSLGHRVDFVLKRLEVLETDPPSLIRPYDIDRFLTNFCKWQRTENPASDADPLHWDHALILTGLDLYVVHQSGKISNQVVGLAPVAGMCTKSSSCTVNEGRHFESVFVVAHEIGHNLGMRHDGPQAENNCDPTSHIMSPTLGSGKITWSPCSKKYLDLFLDTAQAKCLFDKAKSDRWLDHTADGRLPGERFDADRQCVLKYGRGSFHATQQPLEDVCRDLHCRREFFTWTSHPALDGTRCSAADDMWCRAGKCVPKLTGPSPLSSYELSGVGNNANNGNHEGFSGGSNHLPGSETAAYVTQKALDGGWGKWSPFTDCSSACLYADDGTLTMGSTGVRLAARRCDSPRPENGGRQCNGPDRRYKTCSTNKVCTKNPSRTTVSQYAAEVCNRAAQVDTELTGRGYMSSSNDPERACSVWCETNDNSGPRSRGWSFADGSVCRLMSLPKNAQAFCIAGKCQEFTCNPYSHFRLSEDDCAFTSTNDVIPSKSSSDISNWFGGASGVVKINHRSGKVGWSDWEPHSDCKVACLAPAKGLQLVKRQCASDDALCSGLSLSVRLCKPDKYTVQSNGCSRLQTPFEYATKVCSKYADKVSGLSGIGMQLSPTKDDGDRPCRIGCQDASIAYRFYMVNGEEGWFPAGTDCSRGEQDKKAYCMAGKCVDFGDDDTPLYQINNNMMSSLFQQTRSKRQAVYNIMEPLKTDASLDESSLKELVHKFSQETGNYPSIVQRSRASQRRSSSDGQPVDFSRPVVIPSSDTSSTYPYSSSSRGISNTYSYPNTNDIFLTKQKNPLEASSSRKDSHRGRSLDMDFVDVKSEWIGSNNPPAFAHRSGQSSSLGGAQFIASHGVFKTQPIEGSYYEWRKIVSDCSVACGSGIQEVIVQCVSGDTVVNDSLCQGRPRPGYSGYVNCHKPACGRSSTSSNVGGDGKGSHIWNWIQSILPPKDKSYGSNGRSY